MKPKKLVMLALLSALITTIIFYMFMNTTYSKTESPAAEIEMVSVVAVKEDILKDSKITEENLILKQIPAQQVHPQSIKDVKEVIGKYTASKVVQGEVVLNHHLQTKKEESAVVSRKVKEGYRGFSISVDYVTSVSSLIEPEDYVDVVLTTGKDEAKSEVIAERVRVLAVGKRMVEKKVDGSEEAYQAVTVELNQENTVKVINASAKGSLHLALYSKYEPKKKAASKGAAAEKAANESYLTTVPPQSIIRTGPSLSSPVLTVVKHGTQLTITDSKEIDDSSIIWFQVETPNKENGWISSRIVKHKEE